MELIIDNVSKTYGNNVQALKNISLKRLLLVSEKMSREQEQKKGFLVLDLMRGNGI